MSIEYNNIEYNNIEYNNIVELVNILHKFVYESDKTEEYMYRTPRAGLARMRRSRTAVSKIAASTP